MFLQDKYKRSLAETENLRARLQKQIEDARRFGIQGFCKDLLEVADILGHATQAVPKSEVSNNNVHLKNLYEGLTMTRDSMQQVFKRHGLESINPINEKFNPNFHEALFQKVNHFLSLSKRFLKCVCFFFLFQETKEIDPDHVVEVTKIGYKLHERCIRPALVGVSRNWSPTLALRVLPPPPPNDDSHTVCAPNQFLLCANVVKRFFVCYKFLPRMKGGE